ncbi:MAG: DUF2284 domain-containing protein [Desulfarculaceae bacterium]|jgi:predicted metal-binding protein
MAVNQDPGLDQLIQKSGFEDYKWVDPKKIVVAQWVRMKCMFGCPIFGKGASCPPHTPSVAECERFFKEYQRAVIFHFPKKLEAKDRHVWSKKINLRLAKLERDVFVSGFERAFMTFMDSCGLCKECSGQREACKEPRLSRPSPEGMAVDVYTTVRSFGFPIQVKSNYDQAMDRYAFLMVD